MTLYEITTDIQQLLEMAQDPEVDPQIISDTMEGLEAELETKAEGYIVVIKELEAQEEKYRAEISRLGKHLDTIGKNIDRMKNRLLEAMQAAGKDKLPTEHFKLSVAKNGGLAPLVYDRDVPSEYRKIVYQIDTQKIRDALKTEKLDFAHLGERGVHLGIK